MPTKKTKFRLPRFETQKQHGRFNEVQYFCVGSNVLGNKTKVVIQESDEPREKDTCTSYCVQFKTWKGHETYHKELDRKMQENEVTRNEKSLAPWEALRNKNQETRQMSRRYQP